MMAHPDTLRELLTRYEALHGRPAERRELEDISYTLCVSTATREIGEAIAAARAHIQETPAAPSAPAAPTVPAPPAQAGAERTAA